MNILKTNDENVLRKCPVNSLSNLTLSRKENRERNEEIMLAYCQKFFDKYGNLAISQNCVYEDAMGITYPIGRMLERVKKFVKGNSNYIFSKDFIETLLKIDPRVFENNYTQNLLREQKEDKLMGFFTQYYKHYGNLAISARYLHTDHQSGETFPLGKELCCIKEYTKGIGRRKYSDSFLENLKNMDRRVFEDNYPRNIQKETRERLGH